MKIFTLMIIMLCSLSTANAAEKPKFNSIDISIRSYHFADRCYSKCEKRFKEDNYGIGLIYGNHRAQAVIGTLLNSFDKQSTYGGLNITMNARLANGVYWRPGIMLGVADGYDDTPLKINNEEQGVVPIISPNLSMYYGRAHVNLGILPSANTAVGILRVGLRF